jgi:hypothetical protein
VAVLSTRESEPVLDGNETMKEHTLTSVRLSYTFIAFGINSTQLSSSMNGLGLEWRDGHLVVTSTSYPKQEKHIFPTGICEVTWTKS